MRVAALDIVLWDTFTQRKYRPACAFAQSNLNFHLGTLDSEEYKVFFMQTTETLIRLRGCVRLFVSSMGAYIRRYVFSGFGSYNGATGEKVHVVES